MPFQTPITIATALNHIQDNEYVLPAIQREFVWGANQITTLFDSLMRGYPIGAFLFWKVDGSHCNQFKFYRFLSRYHALKHRHNEPIDLTGRPGVTAILDGQQRLTSLNIGLRGTYAYKTKRLWRNNPKAFPERQLYLNLLRPANEGTAVELRYDFRFLTKQRANKSSDVEHWFLLKHVLKFKDLANVMDYLSEHALWESQHARDCLQKLLQVVCKDPLISFYQEDDQDIDKVLNIFIRVNSGGTVLSPHFSSGKQ